MGITLFQHNQEAYEAALFILSEKGSRQSFTQPARENPSSASSWGRGYATVVNPAKNAIP